MARVKQIKTSDLPRRLSRLRTWFLIGTLMVPTLILASISINVQRSFLIEADTGILHIVFDGANAWSLPGATVCLPLEVPQRDASSEDGTPCSAIDQMAQPIDSASIRWPDRAQVTLRAEPTAEGTQLRILLPDGLEGLYPPRTNIVLPAERWRAGGALLFTGEATLGTILGSGERFYLHDATWEARQTSLATDLLGSGTETSLSGSAIAGSQIAIETRDREGWILRPEATPATVFGHIISADTPAGTASVAVSIVSEPGRTELRLDQYGLGLSARLRPNILDAASSSVLLIAALTVVSLAAAAAQLIGDLVFAGRTRDTQNQQLQESKNRRATRHRLNPRPGPTRRRR